MQYQNAALSYSWMRPLTHIQAFFVYTCKQSNVNVCKYCMHQWILSFTVGRHMGTLHAGTHTVTEAAVATWKTGEHLCMMHHLAVQCTVTTAPVTQPVVLPSFLPPLLIWLHDHKVGGSTVLVFCPDILNYVLSLKGKYLILEPNAVSNLVVVYIYIF